MMGKPRLGIAIGGTLLTLALALPQAASGGVLDNVLGDVDDTVNETVGGVLGGSGGSGGSAAPLPAPAPAPAPAAGGPETAPPLDGSTPHADGTVIDTDVENPVLPDLGVTVGESRGEQDSQGRYSGVVNVITVTGLGAPIRLGIGTGEGETATGPLGPLNDALDELCTASDLCLTVLDYDSSTTGKGSQNSFSAASVDLLDGVVAAGAVSSRGDISETDRCQTADSESSAANAGVLQGTVDADVLASESHSEACRGESPESTNDSTVAPDAEDPQDPECPDPGDPDCDGGNDPECQDAGDAACGEISPEGPGGPSGPGDGGGPGGPSGDSPGNLPFTGADLATLGLVGGLVMAAGLGLMALADRRRKAVA